MGKLFRRLLLVALLLVLAGVAAGLWGYRQLRGDPDWYVAAAVPADPAAREQAAQRAEDKMLEARNWAASVASAEARAHRDARPVPRTGEVVVSFTDEELTAFFQKWARVQGWESSYAHYLTEPVFVVRDGELVFAARVRELGLVMSLHYSPQLDVATGRLRLKLVRVMAGKLPLPPAVFATQRDRLKKALSDGSVGWQRSAELDARGTANAAAALAALNSLLVAALDDAPTDSVAFLPVDDRRYVLVRLTGVTVADGRITVTAVGLPADERAGLIDRLKRPAPAQSAAAR